MLVVKPAFAEAARPIARPIVDAMRAVILAADFAAAHGSNLQEKCVGTLSVTETKRPQNTAFGLLVNLGLLRDGYFLLGKLFGPTTGALGGPQ
jgi:hypothetical protein